MVQSQGSRGQLIFVEESVWGTTPGSPSCFGIPFTSESLNLAIGAIISAEIRSDRMVQNIVQGNKNPSGAINFELQPEGLSTLIKHALGSNTTTGTASPYTHTIKGASTLPVGLSIEKGFTDISQYFVFAGCRINTLNLTFPLEGIVTGSFDILAKGVSTAGSSIDSSPTYPTKEPFTSFEAAVLEGGSPLGTVTAATLTINNNLQADGFVMGDDERASMVPGQRAVTGSITAFFEDLTLFNKFLNATQSSLKITLTKGSDIHEILIPKLEYTGTLPTIGSTAPIVIEMPFQGINDAGGEDTDIKYTITNTEATI